MLNLGIHCDIMQPEFSVLSDTAKRSVSVQKNNAVGVLVMRLQVPRPTKGHEHLVHMAHHEFRDKLIVLGDHGGLRTCRDPLTYNERKTMIQECFPAEMSIAVERLRDHPFSPRRWCNWLDDLVTSKYGDRPAVMIASRDGFLDIYKKFGRHETLYVEPLVDVSGTAVRESIQHSSAMSAREAIIHHEVNRPSIAYSAADIAVVDDLSERVLGIDKHWFDGLSSFPGGFVDPEKDENDESAARREQSEELPDIKTDGKYLQLGQRIRVADPRYRNSKDKIYASLFVTRYRSGTLTPGDDAKGARWFARDELVKKFVPWHQPHVRRIVMRWNTMRGRDPEDGLPPQE
jgi:ADP-ribose pyrophosphatase YjhB (NUDIX family)